MNKPPKKKNNYIDNEQFYQDLKKYYYECKGKTGNDKPRIPDHIGACFRLIAMRQADRKEFYNYSYKEDMISDGIFDCVRYILTFNPEKSRYPFTYFSKVCYMAFVRRIGKEKKYLYTKFKVIDNAEIHGFLSTVQDHDSNDQAIMDDVGYSKESRLNMYNFIEDYERKKREKEEKRKEAKKLASEAEAADEDLEEDFDENDEE